MEKRFGDKRYTFSGDDAIERHLDEVVNGVVDRLISNIKPVSVFLSGSLAKGEMTAFKVDDKIEIISDFEIGVVDWNWTKRNKLRKIERLLSRGYGIDITLLFFLPRRFKKCVPLNWAVRNSPLSIEQYELMKAARFVYGRDFKEECPLVNSSDIPLWEGVRLLFNRIAELVGVLTSDQMDDNKFFKACDKLLIACGDAMLLSGDSYHHLYRERQKLFEEKTNFVKGTASKLSCNEARAIIDAYERKICAKGYKTLSKNELFSNTLCVSEIVFKEVISNLMKIDFSSAEQFCERYLNHQNLSEYCRTNSRLTNVVCLLKNRNKIKPFSITQFLKPVPVQHRIYADVYLWLFGKYKTCWLESGSISFENVEIVSMGQDVFEKWKQFCL